jgi:hypothetical protein
MGHLFESKTGNIIVEKVPTRRTANAPPAIPGYQEFKMLVTDDAPFIDLPHPQWLLAKTGISIVVKFGIKYPSTGFL